VGNQLRPGRQPHLHGWRRLHGDADGDGHLWLRRHGTGAKRGASSAAGLPAAGAAQLPLSEGAAHHWQVPPTRQAIGRETWLSLHSKDSCWIERSSLTGNRCCDCGAEISQGATRCRRCEGIRRWKDAEFRSNILETWASPESQRRRSAASRERWQDDEYREKMSDAATALQTEEYRRKRSHIARALWQDEEYRRKVSDGVRAASHALWRDKKYRSKQATARQAEGYRRKRSQIAQALWRDEEYRSKQTTARQAEEYRRKRSQIAQALWRDEEYRSKQTRAQRKDGDAP
jgi:ribosomal protein L40E